MYPGPLVKNFVSWEKDPFLTRPVSGVRPFRATALPLPKDEL